jgi:hypothetical protein
VLIVFDRTFNAHLFTPEGEASKEFVKPSVRILINHLCCSGCFSDTLAGLEKLGWLDNIRLVKEGLPSKEEAESEQVSPSGYANQVTADVTDLTQVDFVELNRSLRERGMAAGLIEFGGVPHFKMKAEVDHLCCKLCVTGLEEAFRPKKDPKYGSTLPWLDSVTVSLVGKSITIYPKQQTSVDAAEALQTMDRAGLPARNLTVDVERKEELNFPTR